MTKLLENKVALITGANRGIGAACAALFARHGSKLVLAARNADLLEDVANGLREQGAEVIASVCDIGHPEQVAELHSRAQRQYGQVDILINNAAVVTPVGLVQDAELNALQQALNINLMGAINCIRAVLPSMLDRGTGRIVSVSSGAAKIDIPGAAIYCAAKAGLERFCTTLAQEVLGSGVEVSVLRPGIVATRMQEVLRDQDAADFPLVARWQAFHSEGHLHAADRPAQGLLWLASNHAAGSNGSIFDINDADFQARINSDLTP